MILLVLMKLWSTFVSVLDVLTITVLIIMKCFNVLLCFESMIFLKESEYIPVDSQLLASQLSAHL